MDRKNLGQNLSGHCIKVNIQVAKKPVNRYHFIKVASVSTFLCHDRGDGHGSAHSVTMWRAGQLRSLYFVGGKHTLSISKEGGG